ncbi:MAG: hypothetical protein GF411_03810 [Candidatus Lokiarchaeota archaeon]|nr:hypothetical protein [Candidatus Lokiarchaeota archaeon]
MSDFGSISVSESGVGDSSVSEGGFDSTPSDSGLSGSVGVSDGFDSVASYGLLGLETHLYYITMDNLYDIALSDLYEIEMDASGFPGSGSVV